MRSTQEILEAAQWVEVEWREGGHEISNQALFYGIRDGLLWALGAYKPVVQALSEGRVQ